MWDASFAGGEAGGWAGDASFQTDVKRDLKAVAIEERLPVPVRIADLADNINQQEDKYPIGNFKFTTVMTVGDVQSITEDNGSKSYVLMDPEDNDKTFVAVKYDSANSFDNDITEGERVRAIGKLKGFDGTNTIMVFNLVEYSDEKEYKIFQLEAQAAQLFYQKNVSDLMKTEKANKMTGMLAPPFKRGQNSTSSESSNVDTKERLYNNVKPTSSGQDKKPTIKEDMNIKERIIDLLKSVQSQVGDEGSHIDWISSQIGCPNDDDLKDCLAGMVDGGFIYPAATEDHFATI